MNISEQTVPLEGVHDLPIMVFHVHDLAHHVQQVRKLQHTGGIGIHLNCQVLQKSHKILKKKKEIHLQLILCWVEAELSEDVTQQLRLHLTQG